MTYDHNYTTHQEHQSSEKKRFTCVVILWWRNEARNLTIPFSGGCTVFEASENWGVTIPGILMESDIMGCLSDKSMCVGVLCTILDIGKKWKLKNCAFREM